MNSRLPIHAMKPRFLKELPRSLYVQGPDPTTLIQSEQRRSFLKRLRKGDTNAGHSLMANRPVRVTFNVAAWVRAENSDGQMLSLMLVVEDNMGKTALLIDEVRSRGEPSLMLSGEVLLACRSVPDSVYIALSGLHPDQPVSLDELYVQPASESTSQQAPLRYQG